MKSTIYQNQRSTNTTSAPVLAFRTVTYCTENEETPGKNTNVYLGSAELSAICSKLGRIPSKEEYLADVGVINQSSDKIYQYLNFDQIEEYVENAKEATA